MARKNPSRRKILKGISASVGAGALVPTAQAKSSSRGEIATKTGQPLQSVPSTDIHEDSVRSFQQQYGSETAIRQALADHASEVLAELEDQGYLSSSSIDEFPTGNIRNEAKIVSPATDIEGAAVFGVRQEGQESALVSVSTSTGAADVSVYVQPERDVSYAVVDTGDDEIIVLGRAMAPSCLSDCVMCGRTCSGTVCMKHRLGFGSMGEEYKHIDCVDYDGDRTIITDVGCIC